MYHPLRSKASGLLTAWLCVAAAASCGSGGSGRNSGGTGSAAGATGGLLSSNGGATSPGSGGSAGGSGAAASAAVAAVAGGGTAPASGGSGASAGTGGSAGSAGAAGGSPANPVWNGTLPTFTKHTIAAFSGGYTTLVADIDRDGLPDVVALASSGSEGVVWFKNPSWKKYTITNSAQAMIFMAPYDIDGDGDLDLAVASDFDLNDASSGGTISWAEAPADPTQGQAWPLRKIDAIPTTHRLRWADLDGDGKKELVALPILGTGSASTADSKTVQLKAYTIPSAPKDAQATWKAQVIDDSHLKVAHSLRIVDWDGDKAEDLLTAANDGVFLFRPSLGKGAEHIAAGASGQAPDKGSSDVVLGKLGAARFIATIDPWHGTDAVVYTPGASEAELWSRQVVGAGDFTHGHGMAIADLNRDGFDEVIVGGGQGTMNELIYRYTPSTHAWDKIKLDSGAVAVSELEAHDMNGDGAIDIVAIGTSPTNNLVWYESSR